MIKSKHMKLAIACLVFLIQFTLLIFAISKSFSPVPFWDTWNGGLEWFLNLNRDGLGSFFNLHNEHRIAITHVLQWVDFSFFSGTGFFLVIVNVLLLLILQVLVLVGYKISSELQGVRPNLEIAILLFAVLGLSWVQKENIVWSFQSQFFLAYLLPLATFISFSRISSGSIRSKVLVLVLGGLSCFSMGNGLLVLPLVLVFSILLRLTWMWIVLCAISALLISNLYLAGSSSSGSLGGLVESPIEVTKFFLLLVGNPVVAFFGADSATGLVAVTFGSVFLGLVVFLFIVLYRKEAHSLFSNPLALFLVYIIGSLLLISAGRYSYGVEQAISSRYTTPVIFAYISLALLSANYFKKELLSKILISLFLVPSIVFQFRAATLFAPEQEERALAGVATVLDVVDRKVTDRIWPFENAKDLAKRAQAANVSLFSQQPWATLDKFIGSTNFSGFQKCTLEIQEFESVGPGSEVLRAKGLISSSQIRNDGSVIKVSSQKGLGIGVGVAGAIQESAQPGLLLAPSTTYKFQGYFQLGVLNAKKTEDFLCK